MTKEHAGREKKIGSRFGKMFSRVKRSPRAHSDEALQALSPPSLNADEEDDAAVAKVTASPPSIEKPPPSHCINADVPKVENGETLADTAGGTTGEVHKDTDDGYETPPPEEEGQDKEATKATTVLVSIKEKGAVSPEHKYSVHHGESWQRLHDMFEKNPSVPKLVESPRLTKSKAQVGEIDKDHIKSVKDLTHRLDHYSEDTKESNERSNITHTVGGHVKERLQCLEQAIKTPESPAQVDEHPNLAQ